MLHLIYLAAFLYVLFDGLINSSGQSLLDPDDAFPMETNAATILQWFLSIQCFNFEEEIRLPDPSRHRPPSGYEMASMNCHRKNHGCFLKKIAFSFVLGNRTFSKVLPNMQVSNELLSVT